METPQDLRYTKTHEWVKPQGKDVTVGITAHAQQELRDVVYVELPAIGRTVKQGEAVAVVESVKAAFDIYAPVSGTVSRRNEELSKTPQLVNQDCYGKGWFYAITPGDPAQVHALLSPSDYEQLTKAEAH